MKVSQLGTLLGKRALPSTCRYRNVRVVTCSARGSVPDRGAVVIDGPFKGMFGEWVLTQADVDGVVQYRTLLLIASLCALGSNIALHLPSSPAHVADVLFALHTAALGGALWKIHIYLRPLHRALQALWAAGAAGVIVLLASSGGSSVIDMVLQKPALMLAVGWQFMAMTGVFFKEAVCFGRFEALALTALVPVLAGGHFLGILPDSFGDIGMWTFLATYVFFAARKFTQPEKDDIGDLSVFQYMDIKANV